MLIPSTDRCFRYGDGLFETILFSGSVPVLFEQHLNRLRLGLQKLGIVWSSDEAMVLQKCLTAIDASNLASSDNATGRLLVRLQISRGEGGRGYLPPYENRCIELLSVYVAGDIPDAVALVSLQSRLMISTLLADLKHCSRLEQVIAAAELSSAESAWEGLLYDELGFLCEGTRSNILLDLDGTIHTPLLDRSGLSSCVIAAISDPRHRLHHQVVQSRLRFADAHTGEVLHGEHKHVLKHATEFHKSAWKSQRLSGLAVCNSVSGIVQVASLDGCALPRSAILQELGERFQAHLAELALGIAG